MGPSDEQGRVGRLWATACRAGDAQHWTRVEYAAVELAVGPVGLVDLIAESMLLSLCRGVRRRGWDPVELRRRSVAADRPKGPEARLLDLVLRLDRVRGGRSVAPRSGWLAAWRTACELPLTESYVAVVRARQVWAQPSTTGDLSA